MPPIDETEKTGLEHFVGLVERMRAAQRAYFEFRKPADMRMAMALEAQVDAAVRAVRNPGLWDRREP